MQYELLWKDIRGTQLRREPARERLSDDGRDKLNRFGEGGLASVLNVLECERTVAACPTPPLHQEQEPVASLHQRVVRHV